MVPSSPTLLPFCVPQQSSNTSKSVSASSRPSPQQGRATIHPCTPASMPLPRGSGPAPSSFCKPYLTCSRKERKAEERKNLPVNLAPLSQQSKEGWSHKRTFGANLTPADQGGCPLHATQTQKAACVLTPCGHSCLRPEQDQRSEPDGHQHQHPPGTGTGEPRTSAQSLEEPAELPSDQGRGSEVVGHRLANQKPVGTLLAPWGKREEGACDH